MNTIFHCTFTAVTFTYPLQLYKFVLVTMKAIDKYVL